MTDQEYNEYIQRELQALAEYRENRQVDLKDWPLILALSAGTAVSVFKQGGAITPDNADEWVGQLQGALKAATEQDASVSDGNGSAH